MEEGRKVGRDLREAEWEQKHWHWAPALQADGRVRGQTGQGCRADPHAQAARRALSEVK